MKYLLPLALCFFVLSHCSRSEHKITPVPAYDVREHITGTYTLPVTADYWWAEPNIADYEPPTSFRTQLHLSDYADEITLTNLHGFSLCLYAQWDGEGFKIPLQETRLQEEALGLRIVPDYPDVTLSVSGYIYVWRVPRTDSLPPHWLWELSYAWQYDGFPVVKASCPPQMMADEVLERRTCE